MARGFHWLLVVTTGFEGLRAGAGIFRMVLDLPARSAIGPVAFAQFSRSTDLSPVGVPFYVVYGVGGLLLTAACWVGALRAGAPGQVKMLTGISALCSLAIMGLTAIAAPLMFAVGGAGDDAARLEMLLDAFAFWTNWRIGLASLSFVAMLLALATASEK